MKQLDQTFSLSRRTSPLIIIMETVVKDFRIARRYLPNLVGEFVQLGFRVGFFLLLANSISISGKGGINSLSTQYEVFLFFMCSMLLLVFRNPTLWAPLNSVTQDLYNGTLEYLYSTPGSKYSYYIGTVVQQLLISLVLFIPFFIYLAFYSKAGFFNILSVLLVCGVVIASLSSLGIIISLIALLWRQVGSIASLIGLLFEFLGGAYLPVQNFPVWLKYLSYILPYTWGYDLIRYYAFDGKWDTLYPVWIEWSILLAFTVFITMLSRLLLAKTEIYISTNGVGVI